MCPILMEKWGNTVSSTIPMALKEMLLKYPLGDKSTILLAGFGVGLSWAGMTVEFQGNDILVDRHK